MKINLKYLYKNLLNLKDLILNIKSMKYSHTTSKIKKTFKLLLLTTENFHISHSSLWSSNLSFYAIFSFIPILAIIMSIGSYLGFRDIIINSLTNFLPLNPEVYKYILSFTDAVMHSTKEGIVTIIALISLVWAIIKIFSLIEYSFNAIWKVESSRNIFRKITDYTSIVIFAPFAIIGSNILSSFINNKLHKITEDIGFFTSLSLNILKFSNIMTMCILLGILYLLIPNTKIKFQYAFLSGIFSGILVFILQYAFFKFQNFLINYDTVYGSFAIIPVFLLWQRFFWNIVLSGCHLSFISQNYYKYDYSLSPIKLSFYENKIISLMIMYIYVKQFENNLNKLSTDDIAHKLKISINLTQNLINHLVKLNLLVKIDSDDDFSYYQPAISIEQLDIETITKKLENNGINNLLEFSENDEYKNIYFQFNDCIKNNINKSLKNL